jgi:5-amino-6-(5-phospho-D-ribitylamino)uracil phosphatase
MAKKHLIALDLDGTLLTNNKQISPNTKKVIQKAREDGHHVMIATGRPYRASEMYYKELELDTPIVNFNGAFVHHPKNHSWGIYHSPLDMPVVLEIVDALKSFNYHNIIAEVLDDIYLHNHDEKLIEIFFKMGGNPNITVGEIKNFLRDSPTSMMIHTDETHLPLIRKHLNEVHAEVVDHRGWAGPWYIVEIIKSGLNKAVGLKRACDYYQIPRERVIAFGDEDNDLEMIEFAGKGIAMGNGIPALKNIAYDVTLPNNEDGVAVYLNDVLNLKAL